MTHPVPRPTPYLPTPLVDEPLDGWLSRIAAGQGATRNQLLTGWRIDQGLRSALLRRPSAHLLTSLSIQTGLAENTLRAMSLYRWEVLGLVPPATSRGSSGGAWNRRTGSRHCPECLDERGGAFRLHWSLYWSFVCVRHQVLLEPTTPETHPYATDFGRAETDQVVRLDTGHPLLWAQRIIDGFLAAPHESINSIGIVRPTWEVFTDLGALTRMALSCPATARPRQLLRDLAQRDGLAIWEELRPALPETLEGTPGRRISEAIRCPGLTGTATAMALRVLHATTPDDAVARMWWITAKARQDASHHARSRRLSWALMRPMSSGHPGRRPKSVLLARFDLARYDAQRTPLIPLDPAKVPAACWPQVTLEGFDKGNDIDSIAVVAALVMIATGRRMLGALQRLGLQHFARSIELDWGRAFENNAQGDRNFHDVIALQQALAAADVPIDYDRRRHTFPTPAPLGERALRRVERATGSTLTPRARTFIAWHVWELVTGSDALLLDTGERIHGAWRSAYRRQRNAWRADPPEVLLLTAEASLYRHRIDEPVTWAPEKLDGQWIAPMEGNQHQLTGWDTTRRRMRGARRADAVTPFELDLGAAVAFAISDTTAGRHLARNLERFVAVVDGGSLKEGGRRLGVNGTTLSVQMRDLERSLSRDLFVRSPSGLQPTPTGRQLRRLIAERDDALTTSAPKHTVRSSPDEGLSDAE